MNLLKFKKLQYQILHLTITYLNPVTTRHEGFFLFVFLFFSVIIETL